MLQIRWTLHETLGFVDGLSLARLHGFLFGHFHNRKVLTQGAFASVRTRQVDVAVAVGFNFSTLTISFWF